MAVAPRGRMRTRLRSAATAACGPGSWRIPSAHEPVGAAALQPFFDDFFRLDDLRDFDLEDDLRDFDFAGDLRDFDFDFAGDFRDFDLDLDDFFFGFGAFAPERR